jgi:hypothetical protein
MSFSRQLSGNLCVPVSDALPGLETGFIQFAVMAVVENGISLKVLKLTKLLPFFFEWDVGKYQFRWFLLEHVVWVVLPFGYAIFNVTIFLLMEVKFLGVHCVLCDFEPGFAQPVGDFCGGFQAAPVGGADYARFAVFGNDFVVFELFQLASDRHSCL